MIVSLPALETTRIGSEGTSTSPTDESGEARGVYRGAKGGKKMRKSGGERGNE